MADTSQNSNVSQSLPTRLDKVQKIASDTGSGEGGSGNTLVGFGLDWSKVNDWDWTNYCQPLTINLTKESQIKGIDPKVRDFAKIAYLYKSLIAKCSSSRFDTAEWGFPFTEEQINSEAINLNMVPGGDYLVWRGDRYHFGQDFAVGGGAGGRRGSDGVTPWTEYSHQDIHAAADGSVLWVNTLEDGDAGGRIVCIQHANLCTIYMHLNDLIVNVGDAITRGQVIGHTGRSGEGTDDCYDEHLHFEVRKNGTDRSTIDNTVDPLSLFTGGITSIDKTVTNYPRLL